MAHEPKQRRDVPGSQPLRLNQPESGAAQRPWFGDETAAPLGSPQPAAKGARPAPLRPVDVQPLTADALAAPGQSSWLLGLEGDTPTEAPPEVDSSEPVPPQTSYVEPETTGTLVSRALAPAGLALMVSFLAVGGFAFWKSGGSPSALVGADPLDADPSIVSGQRRAELVAPPGTVGIAQPARVGTLRAGAPPVAPTAGQAAVLPLPPGPAPVETPVSMPAAAGTTSATIAPAAELRSAVTTPVNPGLQGLPASGELDGADSLADTAPSDGGETTDLASLSLDLDDLLASLSGTRSSAALDTAYGGEDAAEVALSEAPVAVDSMADEVVAPVEDETAFFEQELALVEEPSSGQPLTLDPPAAEVSEPDASVGLVDQLFGVLLAAGTAKAGENPTAGTEEVLAPVVDTGVEPTGLPDVEVRGPMPTRPDDRTAATVALGDSQEIALAVPEPNGNDLPAEAPLDVEWDEPTPMAAEPATASDVAPSTTGQGTAFAALEPFTTPDAEAPEAVTFDTLAEPAESTLDAPSLVGPTIDWPLLDWVTPSDRMAPDPSPVGPMPAGPMPAGPMPDVATLGASPVAQLAPSDAIERRLSSDGTIPSEALGPEAPPRLTQAEHPGASTVTQDTTTLAAELEGLLASVGPRSRPVEGQAPAEPEPEIAADAALESPEVAVVHTTPGDVPIEVMPPVATPSADKGLRSVLRRADEAGSWTALDVPNTVVMGREVLLTPYTGNVRIVFTGGDVFEGRLHAVGQNQITLDTRLGRMTLDARRLERIERLAPEGPAPKSPAKVANDTSGLDEVRVTTRGGGTFVGHLVSRDGNQVTLILVEGYRMTVEAVEVTPALGGRATSSLRRPGDKAPAPVKPANPAPPTRR